MSVINFYIQRKKIDIDCVVGETLFKNLIRNHIPPVSVYITKSGQPVSTFNEVKPDTTYKAVHLEQYDIDLIRDMYVPNNSKKTHTRQEIIPGPTEIRNHRSVYSTNELVEKVEARVQETIERYNMISTDDLMIVGYSGGIDSTALLLALDSIRNRLPNFNILAVYIEDYWPSDRDTAQRPDVEFLDRLGVEYQLTGGKKLSDIYNLKEPVHEIMAEIDPENMSPIAVANNFNRRLYEYKINEEGGDRIAIGNQSTDLIAGFLASMLQNANPPSNSFPFSKIGPYDYIYPLAFEMKPELVKYIKHKSEQPIRYSGFDPWEVTDLDTHFYYFVTEILQSYFPGIVYWLADQPQNGKESFVQSKPCDNCGKYSPSTDYEGTFCRICSFLINNNYCVK